MKQEYQILDRVFVVDYCYDNNLYYVSEEYVTHITCYCLGFDINKPPQVFYRTDKGSHPDKKTFYLQKEEAQKEVNKLNKEVAKKRIEELNKELEEMKELINSK
jgi:hypothetical protein